MEETTINQPFVGVVYLRTLILLDKYSHLLQIGTHYKYTIILRFIILTLSRATFQILSKMRGGGHFGPALEINEEAP